MRTDEQRLKADQYGQFCLGPKTVSVAHTQAVSFQGLARSGLTDLVQLRHVANLIFTPQ